MTHPPPRASWPKLALGGLALLCVAAGLGLQTQRALAEVAALAGASSVRALDIAALLSTLKQHQALAHKLAMLAVGTAASVVVLLALAAVAGRRLRGPAALAAAPSGVSATPGDRRAAGAELGPPGQAANKAANASAAAATAATATVAAPAPPLRAGLLTREQFLAHHHGTVAQAAQQQQRVAVLCFDLERLSSINAMLGFDAGNDAIARTAHRASTLLGADGTVAQLGGGTLAALVRLEGTQSALQRAQALRGALQQSRQWRGQCLELSVTVGFAACPEHGAAPPELLRHAEQALFEARRVGAAVAAYHPAIETARLAHLEMASSLHKALQHNELVPYLQPRWCTRSRHVSGAEVLLRWLHPVQGCLLPAEFLAFAENNGRMTRITQHLLLATVKLLQGSLPAYQLSVNLSAADLREPGLVLKLQRLLQAQGLAPQLLCLEVSEKALTAGGADALARMAELRQTGMAVAIDDFGTGPSPLAQLQQLPASELKLHRSYTVDVDSNPGRQQMLHTLIEMAHGLNLTVTAKGVETPGEREVLERLGCDHLQGYLLGRPMPVADFMALVAAPAGAPAASP